ncbi:regenerating islet-derived protein 3-gamma-like [Sorex araneus]|uniref:regenerating islet-derived protein 3-gamma-like n=1 Tax=Sorex araneus TaxID=42254 RepID=UPI002433B51C|nr:regenerating islet-derived protein 3-gamma-like [Sorex araneus]
MLPPMATVGWLVLSCLALQAQVKGDDLQNKELSPRVRCPRGSEAYGGHCYAFYKTAKSWMDADSECQKRFNGHLVSVLTESEGYFVGSLIKNVGTTYSLVWIGLYDTFEVSQPNVGGWEWINGDVVNYVAWEKGTPTNSGYCGAVLSHTGYEKWQNHNCGNLLPYVCKFDS